MTKSAKFEDILPMLVSTYQRGHLVPFLGAGMSAPKLTLWKDFLAKLEKHAGSCSDPDKVSSDARAQRASTIIQNRDGPAGFLATLRDALRTKVQEVPKSTTSLAQISWPLVVSTNYDDLFFYACRCRHPAEVGDEWPNEMGVEVLGRSPRDCKLVFSSLTGPFDRQYIWHVQGFLGGQFPGRNPEIDVPSIRALQEQLVIGHAEYRRVTNRAPDFRRCFTEVFNSRSLLFLGSSLKEDYFLNLFGEVLDLCGPSAVPHFAFTKEGEVDANFLADQMNITVCEFRKWEELPNWLDCLKKEIDKPGARSAGWSFVIEPSPQTEPDLEIVTGRQSPEVAGAREAIAFVARRDKKDLPILPDQFKHLALERPCPISDHIFLYPTSHVYAVTARCRKNDDGRAVYFAARDLLEEVTATNHAVTTVHLQFSGTGGTVPPIYGFIEVVRTFGEWRARSRRDDKRIRLILYIQRDVELSLTSGRIDIIELLASRLVRFWVVVISSESQEPVRRAVHFSAGTKLKEVLKIVDVPVDSPRWFVSISPSPRKELSKTTTQSVQHLTLVQVGIVFGSVLILEYDART
jgi:hypothetical protein